MSRRVKKGPGRRPQSAKRRRFVQLRERGWSINAPAREVGVSRTTGKNWSRGYKTYRAGQVVGFVPALNRLDVRPIISSKAIPPRYEGKPRSAYEAGVEGTSISACRVLIGGPFGGGGPPAVIRSRRMCGLQPGRLCRRR